uniref:Putative secreted protein n=1 Tax=Anopheles marajoara TaxID=58244 RepID=A0A2M4C641_9DIPT
MPFVLLLTATITGATTCLSFRTHFLVDRLLKVLRIDDGAHLSGRIGRPVRGHDLDLRFARINPSRAGLSTASVTVGGSGRLSSIRSTTATPPATASSCTRRTGALALAAQLTKVRVATETYRSTRITVQIHQLRQQRKLVLSIFLAQQRTTTGGASFPFPAGR